MIQEKKVKNLFQHVTTLSLILVVATTINCLHFVGIVQIQFSKLLDKTMMSFILPYNACNARYFLPHEGALNHFWGYIHSYPKQIQKTGTHYHHRHHLSWTTRLLSHWILSVNSTVQRPTLCVSQLIYK